MEKEIKNQVNNDNSMERPQLYGLTAAATAPSCPAPLEQRNSITPSPHSQHSPQEEGTSTTVSCPLMKNDKASSSFSLAMTQAGMSTQTATSKMTTNSFFAFVPIASAATTTTATTTTTTTSPVPPPPTALATTTDTTTSPAACSATTATTSVAASMTVVSKQPENVLALDVVQPGKRKSASEEQSPAAVVVNNNDDELMLKNSSNSGGGGGSNNKRQKRMSWKQYYPLLIAFKDEYGHLKITKNYKTTTPNGDKIALGVWAQNQRASYWRKQRNEEKKNKITQDRIDRLDKLGFVWRLRDDGGGQQAPPCKQSNSQDAMCGDDDDNDDDTQKEQNKCMTSSSSPSLLLSKKFSAVVHQSEENRCSVKLDPHNNAQKQSSPLLKMSMNNDHQLASTFSHRPPSLWDDYYYQLVFFKATQEHTNVPSDYVCKRTGLALGNWVTQQRALLAASLHDAEMKNMPLSPNIAMRIEKLKEIGFDFFNRGGESGTTTLKNNRDRQNEIIREETPRHDDCVVVAQTEGTCSGPREAGVDINKECNLNNTVEFLKDNSTRPHVKPGNESLLTESSISMKNNKVDSAHVDFGNNKVSTVIFGQQQQITKSQSSSWQPMMMRVLPHPGAPEMQQQQNEQQLLLTTLAHNHTTAMSGSPLISNRAAGRRHEMMPTLPSASTSREWQLLAPLPSPSQDEEEMEFVDYDVRHLVVEDDGATSNDNVINDRFLL